MRAATVVLVALCCGPGPAAALDNGLARTPPMGFSTWSVFRKDVSDGLVRELADALVSTGLADAGYDYLLVDDGWFAKACETCMPARNESGHLNADPQKFPQGIAATADYVHSKGLRFGLWFGHSMCSGTNDAATTTALSTEEGDPDFAVLDAAFFASNGVDAVKHDNCVDVANTSDAIGENYERFARLSRALNATGRPIMYDVVLQVAHARSVPSYDDGYVWSPELYGREAVTSIANMWWSLPVNKYNCWSCCVNGGMNMVDDAMCTSATGHACRRGLLPMLDIQDMGTPGFSVEGHWDWGGPGAWNHLDQLAVCTGQSWYGPGFTHTEQVAQLSLWAVLASPLLISFDVRNVTADCLSLVTNARALAVHQDAAGRPGRRLKNVYGASTSEVEAQVWGRPLADGGVAIVFFNRGEVPRDVTATFEELGLAAGVANVTVMDVWSGAVTRGVESPFTAPAVEAHGVIFVVLTPEIEALI